jgi:glyoxylase-like metal-dependent hydrolase (beta-lactamase superfamily II)
VSLGIRPYTRGLQALGDGVHAWLQPDGSWGWSNAGLVSDAGEALLVDTLFDLKLTAEMLAAMRAAVPAAARIGTVVNTHSNGDHCNGNSLLPQAEIVASAAAAAEMPHESPALMVEYKRAAPALGEMGAFFLECFGAFDFEGVPQRLPTVRFERELELRVGTRSVRLHCVGPAHTRGDTLVHVPDARTVFTGDILFIEGHPVMWAGPVGNWIAACERILLIAPELVVPGHGPVTDARGVRAVRDYLAYVRDEARLRFDAGMGVEEAALDISLADYSSWGDAERIVVNVATLYREFVNDPAPADVAAMFTLMARIRREQAARRRPRA